MSEIQELARLIAQHPDASPRIREMAKTVEQLASESVEEMAEQMVEDAANQNASGLHCKYVYFEEYLDDVASIDAESADALTSHICDYAAEYYPDKRCHLHRSGSDSHTPLRTPTNRYVALTVD